MPGPCDSNVFGMLFRNTLHDEFTIGLDGGYPTRYFRLALPRPVTLYGVIGGCRLRTTVYDKVLSVEGGDTLIGEGTQLAVSWCRGAEPDGGPNLSPIGASFFRSLFCCLG
jgi:hypothetical protein